MSYIVTQANCNALMFQLINASIHSKYNTKLFRGILEEITNYVNDLKDYGSVILQKMNIQVENDNISSILNRYMDYESIEWDYNEFYIAEDVTIEQIGSAVCYIVEHLIIQLCKKFYDRCFCIVISLDSEELSGITAHCYQYRNQNFYFDSDLEAYSQPMLYVVFRAE